MFPAKVMHHDHRRGDIVKEIAALLHLLLYPPFKLFPADQVVHERIVELHAR